MKYLSLSILTLVLFSCSEVPSGAKNIRKISVNEQEDKTVVNPTDLSPKEQFELFKKTLNEEYANSETSPLTKKDRETFKGLEFYPFNKALIVTATVELTPETSFIGLPTTTERMPDYRQYAILHFELAGKEYQLPIYQGKDLMQLEEYKGHLFLPFSDLTNGNETYGGGRYIDAKIPEGNTMELNFNYAYNPYCAYNHKYSCPKIPKENNLTTAIKAGVKKFH